jgi:hypothetical protein
LTSSAARITADIAVIAPLGHSSSEHRDWQQRPQRRRGDGESGDEHRGDGDADGGARHGLNHFGSRDERAAREHRHRSQDNPEAVQHREEMADGDGQRQPDAGAHAVARHDGMGAQKPGRDGGDGDGLGHYPIAETGRRQS